MKTSIESTEPLAIYVTHNDSQVTMKAIDHAFQQKGFKEPSLFFYYDEKNNHYRLNKALSNSYSPEAFYELLATKNIKRIGCDINLGTVNGLSLTEEAHRLIVNSRAQQLVLFTSTDAAKGDARNYFDNQHDYFQLPSTARWGCIKDRSELASVATLEALSPIFSKIMPPQIAIKPRSEDSEPTNSHSLLRWLCCYRSPVKISPKNTTSITIGLKRDPI